MKLQLCIITPEKIVWDKMVNEVILPTTTGQIGILPNHAPLITGIDIGLLKIRTNSEDFSVVVTGGFGLVKFAKSDNITSLTVLVNQAEFYNSSDPQFAIDKVQADFQLAKEAYATAKVGSAKVEAALALKRTQVLLDVVQQS